MDYKKQGNTQIRLWSDTCPILLVLPTPRVLILVGHVAQLPQILSGFGIQSAIIGRGVEHTGRGFPSEAFWKSPDGSEVFVVYLASWYCNALFHSRISPAHSDDDFRKWFNTKLEKVPYLYSKRIFLKYFDEANKRSRCMQSIPQSNTLFYWMAATIQV
jgi:hypothetical protein